MNKFRIRRSKNAVVVTRDYISILKETFPILLLGLGIILLSFGINGIVFAQADGIDSGIAQEAPSSNVVVYDGKQLQLGVCQVLLLVEGQLGALIMVVAGLGAIVRSAFGAYKAAISLVVVACGSFILRSLVSLYFGLPDCSDIEDLGGGQYGIKQGTM